jgi:hypothetical protein
MQHLHYSNGHLFVIRDKTSGDSEMAFIKIALTEQIEDIRRRSLRLDGIASPYLVHRAPDRSRREWTEGKPRWMYAGYLTKAFAEARVCSPDYFAPKLWAISARYAKVISHLGPRQIQMPE